MSKFEEVYLESVSRKEPFQSATKQVKDFLEKANAVAPALWKIEGVSTETQLRHDVRCVFKLVPAKPLLECVETRPLEEFYPTEAFAEKLRGIAGKSLTHGKLTLDNHDIAIDFS